MLAAALLTVYPIRSAPETASQGRIRQIELEIRKRPSEIRLHRELVNLLVEARRFEAGIKAAEAGLLAAPGDEELTLSLSAALIPLGRSSEAIALLSGLQPSGKNRFVLGLAYRSLRQHEQARSALLEAWSLGHRDPYLLYTVIEQDRALGDKQSGLDHFRLFWMEFPNSPWLHILLGDAHAAAGEDASAESEYSKALELNPGLPLANFHLGVLRFQAGDLSTAEAHFRKEIGLNSQVGEAYAYLGHILRAQRRTAEAMSLLEHAVRLDTTSAFAIRELAALQIEAGRLSAALATLRLARRQFPEDSSFAAQLSTVLRRLGRAAEARKEAKRASALMRTKLGQRQTEISGGPRQ